VIWDLKRHGLWEFLSRKLTSKEEEDEGVMRVAGLSQLVLLLAEGCKQARTQIYESMEHVTN
jgi:hypothetical protein